METPKLTDAQRQAILTQPGDFTRVEDDQTHKAYFLIEQTRAEALYDRWLREQLQIGIDQADRGEVAEWSLEDFLAKMHGQQAESD